MFLKSLDIFGFKSFADRTHIDFADGITALLGPNGCGKSNVVDAMKWVLAENKSKNLRAATMEGVIFNGTKNRVYNVPMENTMTNVQTGHSTTLKMVNIELDKPLPDGYFTPNFLNTGRL